MSTFINEYNVEGYVQQHLPMTSGVSKQGKAWQKYETLINTGEGDPVFVTTFGQNGQTLAAIPVNSWVHVSGKISSRLWAEKQRYFVDLKVTTVYPVGPQGQPVQNNHVHGSQPQYSDPVGGPVTGEPVGRQEPQPEEVPGLDSIPF